MQNNLISIIIINYRQKNFLINCVNSIYKNINSYPFEIITVNNSPEDQLSFPEYDNIKVISNQNSGFSRANNTGAKQSKGEYILFLNADTLVENDFFSGLVDYFKEKSFGAVGLKLINPDKTFQLSVYLDNNFWGEMKNKKAEKHFKNKSRSYINNLESGFKDVINVNWVSGAALFMKRRTFEELGGFDERYFLFYEDADLCKRLSDKGHPVYFYPFSEIIHFKGENVNEKFDSDTYYYSKKSQLLYYKLHNNTVDRVLLRIYLFSKFLMLSLITFKKINFRIFKLILGIKNG
jgi:GT2 family glycosyltransferase